MTWVLDLESRAETRAIADARCGPLRVVDAPDTRELAGVVVCTGSTPNLRRIVAGVASAGTRVIVVAPAEDHPEPWSLLASGAADLVLWQDDPQPVLARLDRLHEVERLVTEPPVSDQLLGVSPALRDLVTAARFGRGPIRAVNVHMRQWE